MNKKFASVYILFMTGLVIVNCSPKPTIFEKNPYAEWNLTDPGLQINSLSFPTGTAWKERAQKLDLLRKQTLIAINKIDGIEDLPRAAEDANIYSYKLKAVYASFPDSVNDQLNKYIFAIYFVKNLGSTGLTGIIRDKGKPIGGIIFLDTDLLSKPANRWATAKEETVFTFAPGDGLEVVLEDEKNNSIENALAFIILHEFAHVLASIEGHAPDFSLETRDYRNFPYFSGFWISESVSEYDEKMANRTKIKFYSKKTIPFIPSGLRAYEQLKETPFVTLYSVINADDSFAEAYALYVHCVLQGKPYVVYHTHNSKENKYKNKILENGISKSASESQKLFFKALIR